MEWFTWLILYIALLSFATCLLFIVPEILMLLKNLNAFIVSQMQSPKSEFESKSIPNELPFNERIRQQPEVDGKAKRAEEEEEEETAALGPTESTSTSTLALESVTEVAMETRESTVTETV